MENSFDIPDSETETQPKRAPRRKRLLISPHFQAVFAIYAVITTLVMVPMFVIANFYFFTLFSNKAQALGLPPDHELLRFVERQQVLMVVVFVVATILAILLNVVFSYIFSNRIAGSLHRLTGVMNQTEDLASARQIQPRKSDFFKELYGAYNQLLDRFKS